MDNDINSKNDTAILLVSHGSSLPYAKDTFTEICDKFKSVSSFPTEVGYMKVSQPSLAQAVKNLTENSENIKKIIAIPVFLAPGIHTNIDIPTILGLNPLETDPRCPDGNYPEDHYLTGLEEIDFNGEIKLLNSIGPNPDLLKIIDKRINESLKESKLNNDAKTGILLVSHGSRLNYNKDFITELHSMFSKESNYPSNFGFMELTTPNIPQSINKLTNENDIDRLIVVPVFIAPGVHTTCDIPTILGLKEKDTHSHSHDHSHGHDHHHHHDLEEIDFDGEILYPNPIGADDILIEILQKMAINAL
ncbi:sirohydrochlorin nickelochelatase [Methanobrevibacter sp. OttesenSCG-928-K11]|nr:sirohydrochlorin nickelochelatase [Methanobrevibacter sp. OttesenSCG-928-K11]MDL2270374.1 sirohydrochlorin nickelochelatase [Methanobrevibacter sp. OttesenSCG-928-I08]